MDNVELRRTLRTTEAKRRRTQQVVSRINAAAAGAQAKDPEDRATDEEAEAARAELEAVPDPMPLVELAGLDIAVLDAEIAADLRSKLEGLHVALAQHEELAENLEDYGGKDFNGEVTSVEEQEQMVRAHRATIAALEAELAVLEGEDE